MSKVANYGLIILTHGLVVVNYYAINSQNKIKLEERETKY